jgi:hypothetical protein
MKISFGFEFKWYDGADFVLISLSLLELWKEMEHDLCLELVEITVLKFTVALWLYVDKED